MAEAIGLIASVIQVAGAGLKLSQTLYQYADGVATADRRIKDIAKEIQLTSFVIEELGDVFKHDETSTLMSKNAVKTANETMKECSSVFAEIDATLKKSKKNTLGRLMLPFRDNKIELLRNHIDKLKSTLQLLMQVLTHAHQVATKKLDREAEAKQKAQIQELIELKKQSTKKYEESLRNISLSDGSTMIDPDEEASDKEDLEDESARDLTMAAAAIGSTITSKTLATCVQHIRSLLDDIETLQQALTTKVDGDDHSEHHQSLIGSYFRARGHLDSVLFSGSQAQYNGSDTYQGNCSATSVKSIDVQVDKTGITLNEGLSKQVTLIDGESIDVSQGAADSIVKAGSARPEAELGEPDANRKPMRQEAPKTGRRDGNIEQVRKAPIRLQDNSGRMYSLPYHTCATWELMRNRLVRMYKGTGLQECQIEDGHFDVLDSDGYAILDEDWEDTIEPGMSLNMRFWTINPPIDVVSDLGKRGNDSAEHLSAHQGRGGYNGFDDSGHTMEKEEKEKQVRFASGDANSRGQERADPRLVEIEKDRAETRERLREEAARRRDLRQQRLPTIEKKMEALKTVADTRAKVKDDSEMESPVPGFSAWQSKTEEILTRPDIHTTATATKSGDSTELLDRYSTTNMDADSISDTPAQARQQHQIKQQERGYGQHSPAIASGTNRQVKAKAFLFKHKSTSGLSLGGAALSDRRGKKQKSEGSLPPLSSSATPTTDEIDSDTPSQRPYRPEPERKSPTPSRRATLAPIPGIRPGIQVTRGSGISENSNREGRDNYERINRYNGRDGYEDLGYTMSQREDAKQTLSENGRPRRRAAPTFGTEEYAGARHQFALTTPFSQFSNTPIEVSEATTGSQVISITPKPVNEDAASGVSGSVASLEFTTAADSVVLEQEKISNPLKDGTDKIKIWQATRATSAAPFYFDMAVADTEHDPYKASSKPAHQDQSDQTRTEALQAEIDATVAIMHENINRVSERGARLDSLQGETDNLAASAVAFRRAANQQQSYWTWGNPLAWLTTPFTSPAPLAEIAETSTTLVSETTTTSKITTGVQTYAIGISVPESVSEASVLRLDEKLSASQSGSSQASDSHFNAPTQTVANAGLINLVSSKKPKRRSIETAQPSKDNDEQSSIGIMTGLKAATVKDAKSVGFSSLSQKAIASETPNRPVRRLDGPPFYRFTPPLVTETGKAQFEDNGSAISDISSNPGQAHVLPPTEGAASVSEGHTPPSHSKENRNDGRSLQLLSSSSMIQPSESSIKSKEKADALHTSDSERPLSSVLRDVYHELPISAQQDKQHAAELHEMKRREENERQVLWERESEGRAAASKSRRMVRLPPVISNSSSRRPRASRRGSVTMTPAQKEERRRLLFSELDQMQGERRTAATRDQGERMANPFQQQQDIGYYNRRAATRADRENKSQDEASSSGSKTAQPLPDWLTRSPSECRRMKKGRTEHGKSTGLKELRITSERPDRNDPFLANPKKTRTLGGNSDEDIEISPVGPDSENYSADSSPHASPAPSPPIAPPRLSSNETGTESLVRRLRPKEIESPGVPEPAFNAVPIAVERNVIRTPVYVMKAREERQEALDKSLRLAEEERWRFDEGHFDTVEAGTYTRPTGMVHEELDLELDLSDRARLALFQPFKPSIPAYEQPQFTAPDSNSHSGIRTPQMIMEQRRKREEARARVKVDDGSRSRETRYASAFKPPRPVVPLPSSSHLSSSFQELPRPPHAPNTKAESDEPLYQEMMAGLAGGDSSSGDAKEDSSGDEDEVDALLKDWTTVF